MRYKATLTENDNSFKAICKEAYVATGGGTEAAYQRGYAEGQVEGYAQGKADEYKRLLEGRATGEEPSGDIVIDAVAIAKGAFAYVTKVNSVTLPNATTLIENSFYTSTIKSITIPKVETIGGSVFYMCRNLSTLTFPATLKSIGTSAFGYTTLKSVTFEGTPDSIATGAFTGSNSLTDIYVPWSEGEVAGAPWSATKATIHYNSGV